MWPWNKNNQELVISVSNIFKKSDFFFLEGMECVQTFFVGFESFWIVILTNCIKYLILKGTNELLAPRCRRPLTPKYRRLCSVQNLCLSHSLAKALLTFLQFTWIPCSPPHLPQVTPSHPPTTFTSSSDYLSMCYVSTTILLWSITPKSWPGWRSSLTLFPGQSQYLEHIPNFLSMALGSTL